MVHIVRQNFKYNANLFKKVEEELKTKLGKDVPITHVGSTAIPKMSGKNIIDVLVGARDIKESNELAKKILDLGYFPSLHLKTQEYQFFATRNEETHSGDTHIHLVILGTDRYNDFILLKKYLLRHPEVVKLYVKNKKDVAKIAQRDRHEYRRIKGEFVSQLIEQARKGI